MMMGQRFTGFGLVAEPELAVVNIDAATLVPALVNGARPADIAVDEWDAMTQAGWTPGSIHSLRPDTSSRSWWRRTL